MCLYDLPELQKGFCRFVYQPSIIENLPTPKSSKLVVYTPNFDLLSLTTNAHPQRPAENIG